MLETNLFKPFNSKLDPEQYPQIELLDAVVYKHVPDGPDELCDLLDVHFIGSVRITGTIKTIPVQFRKMLKDLPVNGIKRSKSDLLNKAIGATVTIPDVTVYSLESYDNPKMNSTIWALGYAGWYAITPSAEYRTHFVRSIEKALAWDVSLESGIGPNTKQVTVQQLFKRLMIRHPCCQSMSMAETIFRNHRKFLICKMLEPLKLTGSKKQVNWQNFCLWKWLNTNYTGIVREVEILKEKSKEDGESFRDKRTFDISHKYGFDSLESLALERKLKPHQLTTNWLVSSASKKCARYNLESILSLYQEKAKILRTLMALSCQLNWTESSAYSDLLHISEGIDLNGDWAETAALKGKNGGTGNGEAATTANLKLTPIDDMERDANPLSSPEFPQHPSTSSKGKSVLRPIMASLQRKSEQEGEPSSPILSPPSNETSADLEQLVVPGPSTLAKRKGSGAISSPESSKRIRVTKDSDEEDTTEEDTDDENWPPLIPGGGINPIVWIRLPPMEAPPGSSFWRCWVSTCEKIVPDGDTPAGHIVISDHINEHIEVFRKAGKLIDMKCDGDYVHTRKLIAKIERQSKAWRKTRAAHEADFWEIHADVMAEEKIWLAQQKIEEEEDKKERRALADKIQAEREAKIQAEKEAKMEVKTEAVEEQAVVMAKSTMKGKGKGKGKGKQ